MKSRGWQRLFSLRAKLFVVLVVGFVLSCFVSWLASLGGCWAVERFYMNDGAVSFRQEQYRSSLTEFVEQQRLSTKNVQQISYWIKTQQNIYLIVYDGDEILYESGWWDDSVLGAIDSTILNSSDAVTDTEIGQGQQTDGGSQTEDSEYSKNLWYDLGYFPVEFTDGTYAISIIDYSETDWYSLVDIVSLVLFFVTFAIVLLFYHSSITGHISRLSKEVLLIGQGDMEQNISSKGNDEIALLARNVDKMRNSIVAQIQSEKKAWEANSELITAMSHDIRTPLTSLIGYLDILESKDYQSEEQMERYIKVSKAKSLQLKELSDKLFQYFLVFGKDDIEMSPDTYDAPVLLQQLLGEPILYLQSNGFLVTTESMDTPCSITVDIHFLRRLLDNLFCNIFKYADPLAPVSVKESLEDGKLCIELANRIKTDGQPVESTSIGLKTCEKIVRQMNGTFAVEREDERFIARIHLPIQMEARKEEKET